MFKKSTVITAILVISAITFFSFKQFQSCDPLSRKQLRDVLTQLGYDVKDLETAEGKEKYQVNTSSNGLDVPIGAEISTSTKYIWLTVFLGDFKPENAERNVSLLKQNSTAQPCQFYVTDKGRLMMGLPIENRGVSNAILKEKIEFISARVGESKTIWQ